MVQFFGADFLGTERKATQKQSPTLNPRQNNLFISFYSTYLLPQICFNLVLGVPNVIRMSLHRWISHSINAIQKRPLLRIIELERHILSNARAEEWNPPPGYFVGNTGAVTRLGIPSLNLQET